MIKGRKQTQINKNIKMPNKLRNHRSANRVITDLDQNQPSILHKATPPENSSRIRRIIAIFVVAFAAIALYSIIILLYPPELEEDRLFYEKLDKFVQDNPGAKVLYEYIYIYIEIVKFVEEIRI